MNSDIFNLVNRIDANKDAVISTARIYFMSKNYTLYRVNSRVANEALKPSALYTLINDVQSAAAYGGSVVASNEPAKSVYDIMHMSVGNFITLKYLYSQLSDPINIELFTTDDSEIKKMTAMVVVVEVEGVSVAILKKIRNITTSENSFVINFENRLSEYNTNASFRADPAAFAVITGQDTYALNVGVFESVFKVLPSLKMAARKSAEALSEIYNISCSTIGTQFDILIEHKAPLLRRLANLGTDSDEWPSFDQVMEVVEEFELNLMATEDYTGLIIMDAIDVQTLIDIVEDNYLNGLDGRYLVKGKTEI